MKVTVPLVLTLPKVYRMEVARSDLQPFCVRVPVCVSVSENVNMDVPVRVLAFKEYNLLR